MSRASYLACLFVVLAASGCAARPTPSRTTVTVVVTGDDPLASGVRRTMVAPSELPIDVRVVPAPNAGETVASAAAYDAGERISRARKSYVNGAFDACLGALPEARVPELLGVHARDLAARLLF